MEETCCYPGENVQQQLALSGRYLKSARSSLPRSAMSLKIETPGRRHMSESYKDYMGCKKDWDYSSQSSINNHPIVANDDYGLSPLQETRSSETT